MTDEKTEAEKQKERPTALERFRAKRDWSRENHGWPNTLAEDIEFRHQYLLSEQRDALERIAASLERLVDAAIATTAAGNEYISITADTYEQNS